MLLSTLSAILLFVASMGGQYCFAGTCGGQTQCQCGDEVTSDYTFSGNLACAGNGLRVKKRGIDINGGGYTLSSSDIGTEDDPTVGIDVLGNKGSITNIKITGFGRGIQVQQSVKKYTIGDGITWVETYNNGYKCIGGGCCTVLNPVMFGYGIKVDARKATIQKVKAYGNGDEGIHISGAGQKKQFITLRDSVLYDNGCEELYIFNSKSAKEKSFVENNHICWDETNHTALSCARQAALYLKESENYIFRNNIFQGETTLLTCKVTGSVTKNNKFYGNSFWRVKLSPDENASCSITNNEFIGTYSDTDGDEDDFAFGWPKFPCGGPGEPTCPTRPAAPNWCILNEEADNNKFYNTMLQPNHADSCKDRVVMNDAGVSVTKLYTYGFMTCYDDYSSPPAGCYKQTDWAADGATKAQLLNGATLTFVVKNQSGNPVNGASVYVRSVGDTSKKAGPFNTTAAGVALVKFVYNGKDKNLSPAPAYFDYRKLEYCADKSGMKGTLQEPDDSSPNKDREIELTLDTSGSCGW